MIAFKSALSILGDSKVYTRCIFIPAEHSEELRSWPSKRFICTLNEQESIHCALMPNGNGSFFILINKPLAKKLMVEIGDLVHLSFVEDTSKYGMPVAEEFTLALELDPEGEQLFHQLTPGKQRNLLHLVGNAKASEIRIRKSLVILEYLKSTGGKIEFRELNEALKQANK